MKHKKLCFRLCNSETFRQIFNAHFQALTFISSYFLNMLVSFIVQKTLCVSQTDRRSSPLSQPRCEERHFGSCHSAKSPVCTYSLAIAGGGVGGGGGTILSQVWTVRYVHFQNLARTIFL